MPPTYLIEVLAHEKFARVVMDRPARPDVEVLSVLVADGRAMTAEALASFRSRAGAYVVEQIAQDVLPILAQVGARERRRGLLFCHGLSPRQAEVCNHLKSALGCATAYFCYGGELYARLSAKRMLRLYDEAPWRRRLYDRVVLGREAWRYGVGRGDWTIDRHSQRFLAELDVLATTVRSDRKFLETLVGRPLASVDYLYPVDMSALTGGGDSGARRAVFINHSASRTGNHTYVLTRLAGQALGDRELVLPLSYGNPRRRREIVRAVEALGHPHVRLLEDFLAPPDYIALCRTAVAAIYGHRRQEAIGNLMIMLSLGVRVYLRDDNPLLDDLRALGFAVYSFERELSTLGFAPLEAAASERNRVLVERYASREAWLAGYATLLKHAA